MRRFVSLLALIAVVTSLAGCVVVPAEGYYGGPYYYYYGPYWGPYWGYHGHDWGEHRGWRGR